MIKAFYYLASYVFSFPLAKTVKGIFDSLSDDDDFFFPSVPRCTAAVKNQLPGADKKALRY